MKKLIFVVLIIVIISLTNTCKTDEPHKLFDLKAMYDQGTLEDFLKFTFKNTEIKIKAEQCHSHSKHDISTIILKPQTTEKGKDFIIKVQGDFSEKTKIKELLIETFYNNKQVNKEIVLKDEEKQGPYEYTYSYLIPEYTPNGHWENYFYLKDSEGNTLSCVKTYFDV